MDFVYFANLIQCHSTSQCGPWNWRIIVVFSSFLLITFYLVLICNIKVWKHVINKIINTTGMFSSFKECCTKYFIACYSSSNIWMSQLENQYFRWDFHYWFVLGTLRWIIKDARNPPFLVSSNKIRHRASKSIGNQKQK